VDPAPREGVTEDVGDSPAAPSVIEILYCCMRSLASVAIAWLVLTSGVHAEDSSPPPLSAVSDPATPAQGAPTTDKPEAPAQGEPTDNPEAPEGEEPAPEPEPSKQTFRSKWGTFRDATRGLLTWNLFGGRLTLRGYARLEVDGTKWAFDDKLAAYYDRDQNTQVDMRRLSFHITGTIDHHIRYVAGFEFGPDYGPSDIYVEGIDEGLKVFGYNIGKFRAGYLQEPFSISRVTSSYDSGFLERSLPSWTFGPGDNVGYMIHDTTRKGRLTWQVGFFSFGVGNDANASGSSLSVTGRVTGRPVYRDDGRKLVHVGLSYSTRSPRGSATRYRSRPEARFVDFLVDTGDLDSSRIQLLGLEAAAVRGPLWIMAEGIQSRVTTAAYGDVAFWGSSVEAGWFVTGETRRFDQSCACFGRVIPDSKYVSGLPLRQKDGGAFEIVGRLSGVDLNDGAVQGGRLRDYSVGVNWYVNASSRVMFDVIRADAQDRGNAGIVLLRYQYLPRIR